MYAESSAVHACLRLKYTYRICRHLAGVSGPMGRHRRLDGGCALVHLPHISHGNISAPILFSDFDRNLLKGVQEIISLPLIALHLTQETKTLHLITDVGFGACSGDRA